MQRLEERQVQCPYCGEAIEILIDCSVRRQRYIEDCQVCCRPMNLTVSIESRDAIFIQAAHEND